MILSGLNFLTTDPRTLGVLTWLGVAITVVGLWIAIDQIRKTKNAAQAAKAAVLKLEDAVFSRERLLELTVASSHVANAKEYIAQRNFVSATILIDVALPLCTQVQVLLASRQKARLQRVVLRLQKLTEAISVTQPLEIETIVISATMEARNIVVEMNEIAAALRYTYPTEGSVE